MSKDDDNLPEPTRGPLTPGGLYEIYCKVIPAAQGGHKLVEPWASEPAYLAALALWQCILQPGGKQHTRLQAVKEFNERIYGKIFAAKEGEQSLGSNLDLSLLSDDELATFMGLLQKAQKEEAKDGS